MKNQVIKTPTRGKEYFGYTDNDIIVSSKQHNDINSLIAAVSNKGMLETITHIPIADVRSLQYNENNGLLKIKHQKGSKEKTFRLSFMQIPTRDIVANEIGEIKGLTRSLTTEGKMKPLLISLGITVAVVFFSVVLTGIAYEASVGGEAPEFSGRRSGIATIMTSIATAIGPIGMGIIGLLASGFSGWLALKRWQNPANDVVFK